MRLTRLRPRGRRRWRRSLAQFPLAGDDAAIPALRVMSVATRVLAST